MEESKRSKAEVQDRLSELPDSLIFHIFWFVPMSDVVRTTILSKRWRNRWTTIPFLNFDTENYDTHRFQKFVNRALLRWKGIRILKFKVVDACYRGIIVVDNSMYGDVELWVNFIMDKGVEELYLHLTLDVFSYFDDQYDIYLVPQCLYSCSSLKVLSFNGCFFRIKGDVQWNQLQSLTITECCEVTQHMINQILSGSPRLQVLNLSFIDGDDGGENLNIRSNSLKELWICRSLYHRMHISLVLELTIWTPNLETLKIEGIPYTNCRLTNISSLTCATIGFSGLVYGEGDDCDNFGGFETENGLLSFQEYIEDKFRQTLQAIQHVESVKLFYCCLKVLGAMKMRCMRSSFPNVKSLEIGSCCDNYEQLVGLLSIFPQLERLVLRYKNGEDHQDDPKAVKYESEFPESFLPQLRTIEVS